MKNSFNPVDCKEERKQAIPIYTSLEHPANRHW